MTPYVLSRSIHIPAAPAVVFAWIDDLRRWNDWSPWAKLDPQAQMTYSEPASGVGACMDWAGNQRMGAGRLVVLERQPERTLRYQLEFRRPMEDRAEARLELAREKGGTRVTWVMEGEQTLLGRLLWKLYFGRLVGRQFDEGLASLRDCCAT